MKFDLAAVRNDIAVNGKLRVAINLGNPVLAKCEKKTGVLSGVSVFLANSLADELGMPVSFTRYDAAGHVFDALENAAWDLAFLAIDPLRAEKISFSSPYVCIDGTYLVKNESRFDCVSAVDTVGCRIAVGKGAAYDLYLSRTLEHAELVRSATSAQAMNAFLELDLDAVAGVRQPLEQFALGAPGVRVLRDNFTEIRQAIALPKDRVIAAEYVRHFVIRCLKDGRVAKALDDSGERGARIAQPYAVTSIVE